MQVSTHVINSPSRDAIYGHANTLLPSATDEAAIALLDLLRHKNYQFITVTPTTHAQINARNENAKAVDLRGIFGWNRPFATKVAGPVITTLMEAAGILEDHAGLWLSKARVATLGSQLFMHSAYPTTEPDAVFFGPDTYRFVAAITRHLETNANSIRRAIDIGCGAGPGAITIAEACRYAEIFAVDINDSALRLTGINATAADAKNVLPIRSDLFEQVDGLFDLIVANPPYLVDAGERTYRHGGGQLGEGLSIDIVKEALPRLAKGGSLLLYTGVAIVDGRDPFLAAVRPTLEHSGCAWSYVETDPDIFAEELSVTTYRRAERIAAVVLTVTRP